MDDIKQKIATSVYNAAVSDLESKGYGVEREDDKLTAYCYVDSDVFPISFAVTVDAEKQMLSLISSLEITFPQDSLTDGAVAACITNCQLVDGAFEFDYVTGDLMFRISSSFKGSVISADVFRYLFNRMHATILTYGSELAKLAKGDIMIGAYAYFVEEL